LRRSLDGGGITLVFGSISINICVPRVKHTVKSTPIK
jgi:hypothetical protein